MSKKYAHEMIPGDACHPGELIKEELIARNMKLQDLAADIGIPKSEASQIINNKKNLTAELALKLEKVFGIKAEFWMKVQVKYEIDIIRIAYRDSLENSTIPSNRKSTLNHAISSATAPATNIEYV